MLLLIDFTSLQKETKSHKVLSKLPCTGPGVAGNGNIAAQHTNLNLPSQGASVRAAPVGLGASRKGSILALLWGKYSAVVGP